MEWLKKRWYVPVVVFVLVVMVVVGILYIKKQRRLNKIQLENKEITVMVGSTYQVKVLGMKRTTFKWKSKDESICTVTPEGVVTGVAPGETKIVCHPKGKKIRCRVKVVAEGSTEPLTTSTSDGAASGAAAG